MSRLYEKTATQPGFRYHGNVEIGSALTHQELAHDYHAVLYAVGAARDRRLGIPGEELLGSHAATDFVAWYNGHPDYADRAFDLSAKRALVIGSGNVALDVARMLALTLRELALTDTADHALDAFRTSQIEELVILGSRGPAQAAYTNPELRELADLDDAEVVVDPADAALDPHSEAFIDFDGPNTTARRNVEILHDYARALSGKRRRIVLRFLASPVEILGADRVEGVRGARNALVPSGSGALVPHATGQTEDIEVGLVFRSIG